MTNTPAPPGSGRGEMFRVVAEDYATDAKFRLPLAAISSALTLSIGHPREVRVVVTGKIVCIARSGALFAEDGTELTPTAAVHAAEQLALAPRQR